MFICYVILTSAIKHLINSIHKMLLKPITHGFHTHHFSPLPKGLFTKIPLYVFFT